jgi:(p)ppGpp synthase/HD superfamily hydrolase
MLINTRRVQQALAFASEKHAEVGQMRSTGLPYMVHPYAVTSMVNRCADDYGPHFENALCVASLHDTLEDTKAKFEEIRTLFGDTVAYAVLALTKNGSIGDKFDQLVDSCNRALMVGYWVIGIKAADRTENLSIVTIPEDWSRDRRITYVHKEAPFILYNCRKVGMDLTSKRLEQAMSVYEQYIPSV